MSSIEDLPLGVTSVANGMTVGFDPVLGRKVYIRGYKKTRAYAPDPSSRNTDSQFKGWLVSLMRGKYVSPGRYRSIRASRAEEEYLRRIKKFVDDKLDRSGLGMYERGRAEIVYMGRLALNYRSRR